MHQRLFYQRFVDCDGFADDIYAAMRSDDLSEPVIVALHKLKETNNLPELLKDKKSEEMSTVFRKEGNTAYSGGRFQAAFQLYNKALAHAPKTSRAMKLAISNRSALLFKARSYVACLEDIDICFNLGCPCDIRDKLMKRKEDSLRYILMENLSDDDRISAMADNFFTMKQKRNPQIPCAGTEVGVIVESQIPKIVALKNIPVGRLVAKEPAFASYINKLNYFTACHQCHKMSLNLMPCNGCCIAMFCDESCMELSNNEEHSVECAYMEAFESVSYKPFRIAQKAALKMRKLSENWEEFIAASREMGTQRIKNSSINNTFCSNNCFSLLSMEEKKNFTAGLKYNAALSCAVVMHYLKAVPDFLPKRYDEKMEAIRALARIMMFLAIHPSQLQMVPRVTVAVTRKPTALPCSNNGLYSFIGKLKNSCQPNLLTVTLDKEIALIALKPIRRGTELTISYLGHWLESPTEAGIRRKLMYQLCGQLCACDLCCGRWEQQRSYILNEHQVRCLRRMGLERLRGYLNPERVPFLFPRVCTALAAFHDMPFSQEYTVVYKIFRKCIARMQILSKPNNIIDFK